MPVQNCVGPPHAFYELLTLGKNGNDMKQLVTFSLSFPSVLGTKTQFSSGEPSS